MDVNKRQKITLVYRILEDVLYSLTLYNELKCYFERERSSSNPCEDEFWARIANNSLQMGVLQWAKVFGADKNAIHYTNWIDQSDMVLRLRKKGINAEQVYNAMKDFRNRYVAHSDPESAAVPYIDGALQTVYSFDEALHDKYDLLGLQDGFNDLKSTYEAFRIRIQDILKSISETKSSLLFAES